MAGFQIRLECQHPDYIEQVKGPKTLEGAHTYSDSWLEAFGIKKIIIDDNGTRVYMDGLELPIKPESEMRIRKQSEYPDYTVVIRPFRQIIPE